MTPTTPAVPYLNEDASPTGMLPTSVFPLTQSPQYGGLFWLFLNGQLQIPGLHYVLSQRMVTLFFTTQLGDNLYALYEAVTVSS